MESYFTIDHRDEKYLVGELEKIPTSDSVSEDYYDHDFERVEISVDFIQDLGETVGENDILIVEQEEGRIIRVCGKSEEEKERREAIYDKIMNN